MRPLAFLFLSSLLLACGGATTPLGSALEQRAVDAESYDDVRRQYFVIDPSDPARARVRDRLFAHLDTRTDALLAQRSYERVAEHFASMTSLLLPLDFAEGGTIPPALQRVAAFLVEEGSTRGDEARVLSALLLLAHLDRTNAEAHRAHYERVASWGRRARWGADPHLGPDFLELAPELIDVWDAHARTCPSPEVLERLARIYVDLRDVVTGSVGEGDGPSRAPVGFAQLSMIQALSQRIPLDVAAVFLRVGDLPAAAEHVRQLGDRGGIEWQLRSLIEDAGKEGTAGAEALDRLADGFRRARPEVSRALCQLARRRYPTDSRFPLCLARLGAEMDAPAEATAWYAEAIELSPTDRAVYDEALAQLAELMEQGLFAQNAQIGRIRSIARHALHILEARAVRWPNDAPAISPAQLHYQLGRAEMQAGHATEAMAELEASVGRSRNRAALMELGILRLRLGRAQEAAALFEEVLQEAGEQTPEARLERATILEALGDARRAQGQSDGASAAYREALELFRSLAELGDNARRSLTRVHMAVLASRIANGAQDEELLGALEMAPGWREPYAVVLSYLVVADPDLPLAEEVFRRATRGVALASEWRVYFALWVQAIAARASAPLNDDVRRTLSEQSREEGWHGRLAAFAEGSLNRNALLESAVSAGERCEAHFYAGAKKLAEGDRAAARAEFDAALETGMVSYFEYAMAQELLRQL